MNDNPPKKWPYFVLIALLVLIGVGVWVFNAKNIIGNKDDIKRQLAEVKHNLLLPYRMAEMASRPRENKIPVPVEGVELRRIVDTWGGVRPGGRQHKGVDIFAPKGTPIYSATEGYVMRTGYGNVGGNFIYILGPGGVRYYYAHLDSLEPMMKFGTLVGTTTIIGYVGNTGNASGTPPHLHLGMYAGNGAENPFLLLIDRNI